MEPVEDFYVDGGCRDIVPLSFPINDLGATEVTIVACSPYGETGMQENPKWRSRFPNIVSYMLRAIDTMTSEIQWQDMQLCKIHNLDPSKRKIQLNVYAPSSPTIMDAIDFEPEKLRAGWLLGQRMAEKPILSF
jgi:predicted patatin/cPLA2 family phospholipase